MSSGEPSATIDTWAACSEKPPFYSARLTADQSAASPTRRGCIDRFLQALEARDPAFGRFRAHLLEAGTDLFGAWLVDVTHGRIGTRGRHNGTWCAMRARRKD